jgi:tight adherence protein C
MPILLIVLICLGVAGLAVAAYLFLQERSRRVVVERAIGNPQVAAMRQQIVRTAGRNIGDTIGGRMLKRAPSVWARDTTIQHQLVQAGYDSPIAPLVYSMARVVVLFLLPIVAFILLRDATFLQATAGVGVAAVFGLILPAYYMMRAVRLRQERIRRSLPDALDLLVVCVEAGISLDAAILRVAKDLVYAHPDLARELLVINRKTNAGVTREDALRGLWDRTGVEEVRTLVTSLIQSEKWGASSSRVLRVSSETLRRKRRHSAEKRAATAPIKMVIPLALLIFPALFVVILGPAVLNIIVGFSNR